jgi:hypothetical protein
MRPSAAGETIFLRDGSMVVLARRIGSSLRRTNGRAWRVMKIMAYAARGVSDGSAQYTDALALRRRDEQHGKNPGGCRES